MARIYDATLGWALKRQGFMLLLTVATLILTIWLYVLIPKGFLPAQDTGLLSIVLEGSPDSSFAAMSELQAKVTTAATERKNSARSDVSRKWNAGMAVSVTIAYSAGSSRRRRRS